ncbi:hypothetical protein OH687_21745 [Burkholderia anthina]|nr:hypothetical protein OH687_21745 [Burkholderia anthina]
MDHPKFFFIRPFVGFCVSVRANHFLDLLRVELVSDIIWIWFVRVVPGFDEFPDVLYQFAEDVCVWGGIRV